MKKDWKRTALIILTGLLCLLLIADLVLFTIELVRDIKAPTLSPPCKPTVEVTPTPTPEVNAEQPAKTYIYENKSYHNTTPAAPQTNTDVTTTTQPSGSGSVQAATDEFVGMLEGIGNSYATGDVQGIQDTTKTFSDGLDKYIGTFVP